MLNNKSIAAFWFVGLSAPPGASGGIRSHFGFWFGGLCAVASTVDTATSRMWHIRGGFGRHSIAGQRGYSR